MCKKARLHTGIVVWYGKVFFWALSAQRSHLVGALGRLGPTGWPGTCGTAAGAVGAGKRGDVFHETEIICELYTCVRDIVRILYPWSL